MARDYINDSSALTVVDVSMVIGVGTTIVIEAADIVLMKKNLENVITAIDFSKKTFSSICLNYVGALGYKLQSIPMTTSSVSIVCRSFLLKNYGIPKKLDELEMQGVTVE